MNPILFNTEMVRAILEGRKTVTRRVVKPQPPEGVRTLYPVQGGAVWRSEGINVWVEIKPPYQSGDTLYVRETWCDDWCDHVIYKADGGSAKKAGYAAEPKWRPSIHMPKEAARLFLRVTGVRAERLQNIDKRWSNYDAEGMRNPKLENISVRMKEKFISVWDSTIKPVDLPRYGWEANPWVWAIEFERISKEAAVRGGGDG